MSKLFIARNILYYPGHSSENLHELSDEIIIPNYYLHTLLNTFEEGEPLLLKLTNVDKELSTIVSLGSPHREDKNCIFVPQWILDQIGHSGESPEPVTITKIDSEIPVATKIVIKPLDPIAFELDTLACFEKAMLNLHTIKEGIVIPIGVPELGLDFNMFAYIEKVEPSPLARIVNGEVGVEFINEFSQTQDIDSMNQHTAYEERERKKPKVEELEDFNSGVIPESAISPAIVNTVVQPSLDERRSRIRESWLKRYENNVK